MSNLKNFCQSLSRKALQSVGVGVATTAMALGAGAFAESARAVVIGGQELNEQAFADILKGSVGFIETSGGTVESVLLDDNVSTFAFSFDIGSSVTLGFSNPIMNSVGDDLALFEIGLPDVFSVTINGTTLEYLTSETGEFTDIGQSINLATLDFSDFGIASGGYVDEILIGLDTLSADFGTTPSLALVAGIRSTPEPSSMFGLLAAAGFLVYQCKSKMLKKA